MDRLAALALFLPLVPAFHAIGLLLLRAALPGGAPRRTSPALALSLGVWSLAPLLFLLSAAGGFVPAVTRALYAGLALWGLLQAPRFCRALWPALLAPWRRPDGWFDRSSLFLFAALVLIQTIDAAGYPLGGDQLAYHFPLARHLAATGSLEPLYGLPASSYLPQNVHLYFALGMQVHSDVLGKLFVTLWGFLSYALVFRIARQAFGARAGRWALLLYAFTPWTAYKIHFPFVEIPLAHAVLSAAALFSLHLRTRRCGPLLASGAMVGLALGTKQTAWILLPLLVAFGFWAARRPAPPVGPAWARWRPLALALSLAALLGSPWLFRNLHYLENPVWPLFGFGKYLTPGSGLGQRQYAGALRPEVALRYLYTLFFNYGRDGFSFFSPFLLLSLPFLPGLFRRSLAARGLLIAAAAGLVFCYGLGSIAARYWFPYFALLAPVLGLVVVETSRATFARRLHRAVLLAVGLGVLSTAAISTGSLLRHPSREALYARLPEGPLAAHLKSQVQPPDRVLYPYENGYIFPESVIIVWLSQAWVELYRSDDLPATLRRFRELQVRYLVFSAGRSSDGGYYSAGYTRLVAALLESGRAAEVGRFGDLSLLEVRDPLARR
jgi:hypothetical protein